MTEREALKLALEALKQIDEAMPFPVAKLAQKVIKEALAQPEQPPYHHFVSDRFNIDPQTGNLNIGAVKKQEPVAWIDKMVIDVPNQLFYTAPRTWVGLTEDEILLISADCASSHQHMDIHFARAIEAKLKEKNT